jgi:molecular chaperone DnaK (HSP70)
MQRNLASFVLPFAAATALAALSVVELPTPVVSATGVLVEHVGVETLGGAFTPLLQVGCHIPCSSTQVFSTAEDNQPEISLRLFRGTAKLTAGAKSLGTYAVIGLPAQARGEPQIAITFTVLRESIALEAIDKQSKRPLTIVRREP